MGVWVEASGPLRPMSALRDTYSYRNIRVNASEKVSPYSWDRISATPAQTHLHWPSRVTFQVTSKLI